MNDKELQNIKNLLVGEKIIDVSFATPDGQLYITLGSDGRRIYLDHDETEWLKDMGI